MMKFCINCQSFIYALNLWIMVSVNCWHVNRWALYIIVRRSQAISWQCNRHNDHNSDHNITASKVNHWRFEFHPYIGLYKEVKFSDF